MFSLFLNLGRWVVQRFGGFLLILAILWAGWLVQAQLKVLADLKSNIQYLKTGEFKLRSDLSELEKQTEQSVAKLKRVTGAQLDQKISELTKLIESKKLKLSELDGIFFKFNPATHIDVARLKIEIDLAAQEHEYLRYLKEIHNQTTTVGRLAEYCEKIRQKHLDEWKAYQKTYARLADLNASASIYSQWNPLSDEFKTRQDLEAKRNGHAVNTQNLKSQRDQCLANQASAQRVLNGLEKAKVFELKNHKTKEALTELDRHILEIQGKADKHWLKPILFDPLEKLIPIALGITAAAILVPFAIKLCLYFILAPLAAKQSPICLQPSSKASNPRITMNSRSAVALSIEVAPDSELLVKPPYFRGSPKRCSTTAKFVLNNRFTMMSLVAGMYNLTAVRADEIFIAEVSSGHEMLAELLRLEIGEGDAVCLRPSNLVGIVQQRSCPVRISSHWRLASLQAWLTMQLRYLVFHGPALIIVKGCRGVRVESAVEGRSIEQALTLGFSANLKYSTTRAETLTAYLSGKKGLLRDTFVGQSGFFLFEEMPDASNRSGITGKRIRVAFDTVLKLFGI